MRAWHYLAPRHATRQPRRIVAVACDYAPPAPCGPGGLSPDRLERWAMAISDRKRGHYAPEHLVGEVGPEGFLAQLAGLVGQGGCTWLLGYQVSRLLAAVGWWGRWDRGEWGVSDDDPDQPTPPGESPRKGFRGYLIMEDPPTVIHCRPRYGRGTLKIVDVRNYGVRTEPEAGEPAAWRAIRLGRWAVRTAETLEGRGWGSLQATAGAQGMSIFRSGFIRHPILVHGNEDAAKLESDCLYGGRCEVYRVGTVAGPVVQLDAEACYPTLASLHPLPCRLKHYYRDGKEELAPLLRDGWQCFARVGLHTPDDRYPHRRGGRTIYPVGRYGTALCGPELGDAVASGRVTSVWEVAAYAPDEAFMRFAKELLKLRKEEQAAWPGHGPGQAKLWANGFFGRLAQRGRRWVSCPHVCPPGPWRSWHQVCPPHGPWRPHRTVGWEVQHEEVTQDPPEGCRAVTAWLYGLARWSLGRVMDHLVRHRVLYCDTDSVWVRAPAGEADLATIPPATSLGVRYRIIGRYDWVDFRAAKRYRTSASPAWSGLPAGAVEVAPGCWRAWSSETVRDALSHGRPPDGRIVWRTLEPHARYTDRVVCPDGSTFPIHLEETLR